MNEQHAYRVTCPYNVFIPRKTMPPRKYAVNLNSFRNRKPIVNNTIKKEYFNMVAEQLDLLPHFDEVFIVYKPFYSKGGAHDKGNVLAVTQKFFLDSLVTTGTIDDDNDSIVKEELFMSGEVAKGDERVEVIIFDSKRAFKEYIKNHL